MQIPKFAEDPSKPILHFVRRNFSPYAYLSSIDRDASEARIGLQIQEAIIDHGEIGSTIRTLNIDNVGLFKWRYMHGRMKLHGPSRRQVAMRANERYSAIVDRSQQLLLPSLYTKLVHVPEVEIAMTPLRKILMMLEKEKSVSHRDLGRRFTKDEGAKAKRYFSLLCDLDFVKEEKGRFVPGQSMSELRIDVRPPILYERILAEVIQKRSKYLKEVLHWTMMVASLRWSNAYYFPAYEAGHLIKMADEELGDNYKKFYGIKHEQATELDQIQKIIDNEVLVREEEKYVRGREEIFTSYSRSADEAAILEPQIAR
jgi:hypothetical protein